MKIKPTGDRLLVKVTKLEMYRGFVLPNSNVLQGSASVGEVVGLGQGYTSDKKGDNGEQLWDPLESKVGDRIIFNARAGLGLSAKFRLIHESEIIARITDDGTDIGDEILTGDNE